MSTSGNPVDRDTLIQPYQTAIGAVCEIAEAYYRLGKLEAALGALQAGTLLLEHAPEQQVDQSRTKLLLQQGKLLVTKGFYANSKYEAAISALSQAQEMASASSDERSAADALQLLGQAYYNKALWSGEDSYERPLDYYQQALARREALKDQRGIAESVFYIGLIHERLQQPGEAQNYYTKALALAQEHNCQIEQSYALRHLAGIAQETGDLEQALALFSESLALREAAGYKILLPLSHLAIGDVLLAQRDLPQAIEHYRAAYAISQEMDTPVARIFSLLSLGSQSQQQQELAQARLYFEQALSSAQEIAFPLGITEASRALEEIARQKP
ncbi:MAG TPA: tetratricopeptide repeat protein [Ktedonobacterales bacterium]|nr:tetratricopeptide repeat protein [Ktedonobacterales bacterium]